MTGKLIEMRIDHLSSKSLIVQTPTGFAKRVYICSNTVILWQGHQITPAALFHLIDNADEKEITITTIASNITVTM